FVPRAAARLLPALPVPRAGRAARPVYPAPGGRRRADRPPGAAEAGVPDPGGVEGQRTEDRGQKDTAGFLSSVLCPLSFWDRGWIVNLRCRLVGAALAVLLGGGVGAA